MTANATQGPFSATVSYEAEAVGTLTTKQPQEGRQPRMREELQRRLLLRLSRQIVTIREALAVVRAQTATLAEAESARPLTPNEAARARGLAREHERLRLELQQTRREFARLQSPV